MATLTEKYLKAYENDWLNQAHEYLSGINWNDDTTELGHVLKQARADHRAFYLETYPMTEAEKMEMERMGVWG